MAKTKAKAEAPSASKPILRALNSKSGSCSELEKGQAHLMAVKAERELLNNWLPRSRRRELFGLTWFP